MNVSLLKYKWIFTLVLFLSAFEVFAEQIPEDAFKLELETPHKVYHKHHAGHKQTGFTYGLEYEYSPKERWGIGALGEAIAFSGNHRDLAFAFPVSYYPSEAFKLSAGPGFESDGDRRSLLFRFSAGYHIEIGKFTLSPEIALDLVDGSKTVVYGFTLGRGF